MGKRFTAGQILLGHRCRRRYAAGPQRRQIDVIQDVDADIDGERSERQEGRSGQDESQQAAGKAARWRAWSCPEGDTEGGDTNGKQRQKGYLSRRNGESSFDH